MTKLMRRTMRGTLVALIVLLPISPKAATDDMNSDVRCVVYSMYLLNNGSVTDPAMLNVLQMGVIFYLGRIDGRDPNFEIMNAIQTEVPTLSEADVGPEISRCGAQMKERGEAINQMAWALQNSGKP